MRISIYGSEIERGKSYLIFVVRIHKIVQEFLLQRKELIVREVLLVAIGVLLAAIGLVAVDPSDKSLGMCLAICETWCEMRVEVRGLIVFVLRDSRRVHAHKERRNAENKSEKLHGCCLLFERREWFAALIEKIEALGLIVDEEEMVMSGKKFKGMDTQSKQFHRVL